jgi:CRP-like cAMP-binding protein
MAEQAHLSTVEKVLFLKQAEIFARASIEELGRIATLTQEVQFEPGETIYREGEPVEAIYIILKGRAVVERHGQIIHEISDKHTVGLLAALDLAPALRTVTAKEPIHALKLNVHDFQDILSLDFELVKAVFRALARRVREGPAR